jgi:hypothetical protein
MYFQQTWRETKTMEKRDSFQVGLERDGYNRPLAGLENDDQMDIKWGR